MGATEHSLLRRLEGFQSWHADLLAAFERDATQIPTIDLRDASVREALQTWERRLWASLLEFADQTLTGRRGSDPQRALGILDQASWNSGRKWMETEIAQDRSPRELQLLWSLLRGAWTSPAFSDISEVILRRAAHEYRVLVSFTPQDLRLDPNRSEKPELLEKITRLLLQRTHGATYAYDTRIRFSSQHDRGRLELVFERT